jgi:hypothetical protein
MIEAPVDEDIETRRWVRSHVIGFFAIIGVAAGLIIVDSKVEEIIGEKGMPFFRTVLLVSVLLAGLGARAILAWRTATVDLQGRIFLTAIGLVLLTGAAFGMSNCMQEIREHLKMPGEGQPPAMRVGLPRARPLPRRHQANFEKSGLRRSKNARNASAASGDVSRSPKWASSSVIVSSICRA